MKERHKHILGEIQRKNVDNNMLTLCYVFIYLFIFWTGGLAHVHTHAGYCSAPQKKKHTHIRTHTRTHPHTHTQQTTHST